MSIIPNDLYKRGKSTYRVERAADSIHADGYAAIIASDEGKTSELADGLFAFSNTVASGETYRGGFQTADIVMKHDTSQLVYATELTLNGLVSGLAPLEVTFSDGMNTLRWYSANNLFNASTLFSGTVNGASVSGTAGYRYNLSGDYNACRGTSGGVYRQNVTLRVDVGRGEISMWVGDQLFDASAVAGLSAFGASHWALSFASATSGEHTVRIGQIILAEER